MKRDFSILKEVISPKNVEVMSELIAIQETKFLISLIGGPMIILRNNLYKDMYTKQDSSYCISDSYDLVQECAVFLCEHFGKKLSDTHHIDKNGKRITIEMQAIRKMSRITGAQSRRAKREMALDKLNEQNSPTLEIELEDKHDYTNVDKIIKSLELDETHELALELRMNGLSYPEIAQIIGRAISTSYETIKRVQKRYLAIYGI